MIIEMSVVRNRTLRGRDTFGQWMVPDTTSTTGRRAYCYTLEDAVREVPGMPVSSWKKKHITAIPSGRYRLALEDSPKFGPDTPTLLNVEGYDEIRVHSVGTVEDTDGCIGVGDLPDRERGTLSGGISRGVLKSLKALIKRYIDQGDEVWLSVNNPNTI